MIQRSSPDHQRRGIGRQHGLHKGLTFTRQLPLGLPLCLGLLTLISGCGDGADEGMNRLQPRSAAYLSGIPIPMGFKLIEKFSDDQASGDVRMARHHYSGTGDSRAVANFYVEQMPLHGWNLVSRYSVKGPISMRFENASESATIEIESDVFNRITVRVLVMPLIRSQAERREQQHREPPSKRLVP